MSSFITTRPLDVSELHSIDTISPSKANFLSAKLFILITVSSLIKNHQLCNVDTSSSKMKDGHES